MFEYEIVYHIILQAFTNGDFTTHIQIFTNTSLHRDIINLYLGKTQVVIK